MAEESISGFGSVTPEVIAESAANFGTPLYLYDESVIDQKCKEVLSMPNAYGLTVRYAMKANSNEAILQLIAGKGLHLDLSSLNEGLRAHYAGIQYDKMMLTTQEVPEDLERIILQEMITTGLKYNVCSLRQLELIANFASKYDIPLSMRVHPGVGSGESSTRDTGSKYSCFGVHLTDIEKAMKFAKSKGLVFDTVHVHIGSGGDPDKWRENVDRELEFVEKYFPYADTVNFGGGLKEARMPNEKAADIEYLGSYAKKAIEEFHKKTGRILKMEIEPGTYIMANAGYGVTKVIDKKQTGPDGYKFIVSSAGMEMNARPLLYGSEHPFYVVSKNGKLLSSEFNVSSAKFNLDDFDPSVESRVLVGRCCESGDSQSLDKDGNIVPRLMADPKIGDYVVIGGLGAYCSTMTPSNYNSHEQAPEVLLRSDGRLYPIREEQTLRQVFANELDLEPLNS